MLWAVANALLDIAPIADELILIVEDDVKEIISAHEMSQLRAKTLLTS